MLKYKQVPVNIVGFIVVFCLLGFLIFQTTNHLPTQMNDIKEDVHRLEDKIDKNHREMNEFFRYLMERDKAKDKK